LEGKCQKQKTFRDKYLQERSEIRLFEHQKDTAAGSKKQEKFHTPAWKITH
jgi:hypothetical protein